MRDKAKQECVQEVHGNSFIIIYILTINIQIFYFRIQCVL